MKRVKVHLYLSLPLLPEILSAKSLFQKQLSESLLLCLKPTTPYNKMDKFSVGGASGEQSLKWILFLKCQLSRTEYIPCSSPRCVRFSEQPTNERGRSACGPLCRKCVMAWLFSAHKSERGLSECWSLPLPLSFRLLCAWGDQKQNHVFITAIFSLF